MEHVCCLEAVRRARARVACAAVRRNLFVGKRPIRKRRSGTKGALTAHHGPLLKTSSVARDGKGDPSAHGASDLTDGRLVWITIGAANSIYSLSLNGEGERAELRRFIVD